MAGRAPELSERDGALGRSFRRRGTAGFVLALAVSCWLAGATGLSVPLQLAVVAAAVATFLALAMAEKIARGREALVYYHHEIAVFLVTAAVSALAGGAVLGHLDVTAAGLGAFLCLGRTGCHVAGCCHGRPAARGVRYGSEHVRAGFPQYLEGATLAPVQAVEAGVAGLLCVLAAVLAVAAAPGTAFGAYVAGYALARFALEEWRGDTLRPVWRGLSEAQWTSLLVVAVTATLSASGALPAGGPHLASLGVLLLAAAARALRPRRPAHPLDPGHVRELRHILGRMRGDERPVVRQTALGIRISAGRAGPRRLYSLSSPDRDLAADDLDALAGVLLAEHPPDAGAELVQGVAGVWHVLVADSPDPATGRQ